MDGMFKTFGTTRNVKSALQSNCYHTPFHIKTLNNSNTDNMYLPNNTTTLLRQK